MFAFIKSMYIWITINWKWILIGSGIVSVAVATLGIFVPSSRPALTWLLNSLVTIAQLLFWLLSLPYKVVTGL